MRNFAPWVVAFADVLAVASYIAGVDPILGQVAGLGLKLLVVPKLLRGESIVAIQFGAVLALAAACLLSFGFAGVHTSIDLLKILGFLAHLSLTLMLSRNELGAYLRAVTYLLSGSAILYLIMASTGQITSIWGRYFYFNGLHPNLGSEIAASAAICGAISVRYRVFLGLLVILLANSLLMQGRAAMLTIAFIFLLRTAHEMLIANDSSKVQLRILLATPIAMTGLFFGLPYFSEALLLDDQHRGVGTGFVGRADQWNIAWEAFLDRPIVGQGLGWFERNVEMGRFDLGAHNFFLYGLAEMGLISLVLFAMLARMAVLAYQQHGWKIVSLSPVLVMFMMNDRFVNLNPYPFLVWVLFFALSAAPVARKSSATGVRQIGASVPGRPDYAG